MPSRPVPNLDIDPVCTRAFEHEGSCIRGAVVACNGGVSGSWCLRTSSGSETVRFDDRVLVTPIADVDRILQNAEITICKAYLTILKRSFANAVGHVSNRRRESRYGFCSPSVDA
jgi:hypothetical protein